MAGTANTPPDAGLAGYPQDLLSAGLAAYKVVGTGTALDGQWVLATLLMDPATGQIYKAASTGGGAVTLADGANVTQGTTTDVAAPWNGSAGTSTVLAVLAALWGKLNTLAGAVSAGLVQTQAKGATTTNSYKNIGATKTLVTAGAGKLYAATLANSSAGVAFLQIFDAASTAAVTLGTTVPTWAIGAGSNSTGALTSLPQGRDFANGLVIAALTTADGATGAGTSHVAALDWHS